jgi:hypothetical protein
MTLTVILQCSLNWDLSFFFLIITLGECVLGRKTTEEKDHSHPILTRVHTISHDLSLDVDLGHLAEVVWVLK